LSVRDIEQRLGVDHLYGAIQEYGGFDRPEWLLPPAQRRPPPERS
jgi:hypothetical protein